MINTTISHIIATVTLALLLIFSVYLALNHKKKLRNILLSIFFIANALYLVDYLLVPMQHVSGISLLWFDEIGLSFAFLFGPLILFFMNAIIYPGFRIRTSTLWHFIPFVIFFIAYSIRDNFLCEYGYMLLYMHLFTYYITSFFVLRKHKTQVKSFFSTIQNSNLTWVIHVLLVFILVTIIDLTSAILAFFHWDNATTRADLNFFSVLIHCYFVVYIFYKSIHIPEYHNENSQAIVPLKYSNSKLTSKKKAEILEKIESFFTIDKPYLNPSLTIQDVSDAIEVPMKSISQVINELINKNFYDFTNSYRVAEAKKHLSNTQKDKETILEILYKSGFNSKSSFNTAFKKHTNLTPTQFRNSSIS
jgi:AraC-like DNA-binding protein